MATLDWQSGGAAVSLEFDVTSSQGYEATSEVTEHPVEDGAPISDHVKPNNSSFTLEALITNNPVRVPSGQLQGARRESATVDLSVGGRPLQATVKRWTSEFDRVTECDVLLENLVNARIVVRLTTGLRQVENLIVTRYKVDRNAAAGDSLPVVMEFRRLRIVSVQRVAVPAVRRGQLLDSRGGQTAVPNNSTGFNMAHDAGLV